MARVATESWVTGVPPRWSSSRRGRRWRALAQDPRLDCLPDVVVLAELVQRHGELGAYLLLCGFGLLGLGPCGPVMAAQERQPSGGHVLVRSLSVAAGCPVSARSISSDDRAASSAESARLLAASLVRRRSLMSCRCIQTT